MNDRAAYLDSSAFVKTIIPESESRELNRFLVGRSRLASSALLETEARRAVLRVDASLLDLVEVRIQDVSILAITSEILLAAGTLQPAGLRSLDAIHLATALALGPELECLVTYDDRIAAAATALGLDVRSPH